MSSPLLSDENSNRLLLLLLFEYWVFVRPAKVLLLSGRDDDSSADGGSRRRTTSTVSRSDRVVVGLFDLLDGSFVSKLSVLSGPRRRSSLPDRRSVAADGPTVEEGEVIPWDRCSCLSFCSFSCRSISSSFRLNRLSRFSRFLRHLLLIFYGLF